MESHDLAYLAGFFDGEGCVGIYPNSRKSGFYLSVQIVQNDSPSSRLLFETIRSEWGGSIGERGTSTGTIKLGYQITSHGAAALLADLLPYLKGKYDQAKIAITWQSPRTAWTERDDHGRLVKRSTTAIAADEATALLVKLLKSGRSMQTVIDETPELTETIAEFWEAAA